MRRHPTEGVLPSAAARCRRAAMAAVSGDAAVTPIIAAVLGELRMQIEAAARELLQWRAVAPMPRQKAAGFAGGGAADSGALDNDRFRAAAAQEVCDRGADNAAAADDDAHHSSGARFFARRIVSGRARHPPCATNCKGC